MPQSYATAQMLLPLLLDRLHDYALFMIDTQGRIISWNLGVSRLLGYEENEFLGKESALIYTEEDRLRDVPQEELNTARQQGSAEDIRWHQRKDGSLFWAKGQLIALRDDEGELRGFTKILHDDTQRKQTEEALRNAYAQTETASRLKDEFLSTLSHELRTPLNSILGWANILRTNELDRPIQQQGLEAIERNALSQSELINDLLDVSRILTGKLRLDLRPVELSDVIASAVRNASPSAAAKNLQLETNIDYSTGLISADWDRLEQIFWNLLSNAIKFTPAGGHIRVTLAKVDSQVQVQISDNGQGIAPEVLPHIFERFRQGDASSTRAHGGLGIGLSLVWQLVEAHGGTVWADSAGRGRGTTFTVCFPTLDIAPSQTDKQPVPAPLAEPRPLPLLSGLKILVVDDEVDTRQLIGFVLQQQHAQVYVVQGAQEAFALAAEHQGKGQPFDLLVSDIGMPGEDGYSLLNRIRGWEHQEGGFLPAIALTAYATHDDRMAALMAGFQVHLQKPLDPRELVASIASLKGRTGDG